MAGFHRLAHEARDSQQFSTDFVCGERLLLSEEESSTEMVYSMLVLWSEEILLTEVVHLVRVIGSEDVSADKRQQLLG